MLVGTVIVAVAMTACGLESASGTVLDAHISEFRDLVASGTAHSGGIAKTRVLGVERRGTKVGRNDPCPCGSGKKFKKCCGTIG